MQIYLVNTHFRFTSLFDNVGVAASSGVVCAMIIAVSVLPTIVLQSYGSKWRRGKDEMTS
jgi:predicted RND superfamily exporter protein